MDDYSKLTTDGKEAVKMHYADKDPGMAALYDWYDKTHDRQVNVNGVIGTVTTTGHYDGTTLTNPWYDPNGNVLAPYMPGTAPNSIGGGNIAYPNTWPAPNDNEATIKALTMLIEDLRTKNATMEQRMKDLEAQMNTILTGGDD